ncbi:helix-turn-helix domain-containing protein [Candidatus Venteria ishoeyi]|uniref:Transcriptional repressor DicA n=1 Tax=Candidatus Venteria ishoeyi TaxID=1899563 RepID=A0A1H6F436_9GAMM|nr:helix-turn-helix transcriptional regulator [Candidatus Venteria ishoeyi]SEH04323.1 transcriptional repressor DicA [Candidatus Venteria ishoeyi]
MQLVSAGERLRQEREKLGINQEDMGKIGGVNRLTQGKYERDQREPTRGYLAKIAEAGVDIQYLITGKRSQPDPETEKMTELFEGLNESQQREILSNIQDKKLLNQLLKQLPDKEVG